MILVLHNKFNIMIDYIARSTYNINLDEYYYVKSNNQENIGIQEIKGKAWDYLTENTGYILVKKEDIFSKINKENLHEKCIGIIDPSYKCKHMLYGVDYYTKELKSILCSDIKINKFMHVYGFFTKTELFEEIDNVRMLISKHNLIPNFYSPYTKSELDYILEKFNIFKNQFNIIVNLITDDEYNYIVDYSIDSKNEALSEWLILNTKNKLNNDLIDKMIHSSPNLIQIVSTKSKDTIKHCISQNKKFWCHIPYKSDPEVYEYAVEKYPELIKKLRRDVSKEFLKKALSDEKYTRHIKKDTLKALKEMYF